MERNHGPQRSAKGVTCPCLEAAGYVRYSLTAPVHAVRCANAERSR